MLNTGGGIYYVALPGPSPVFDAFKAESAIQQNRDLMMLSTIVQIDGRYTLFLTKEEAEIMGVSGTMYDKYLNIVEDMNNRKEKLDKKEGKD